MASSQQDDRVQGRQDGRATSLTERNLTLSRMLQLYRTRRAGFQNRLARASENGGDRVDERTEQFIPRTLTQNFMNNAGSGSAHNSFSMLGNSNPRQSAVNRRSENFRNNFDTID